MQSTLLLVKCLYGQPYTLFIILLLSFILFLVNFKCAWDIRKKRRNPIYAALGAGFCLATFIFLLLDYLLHF